MAGLNDECAGGRTRPHRAHEPKPLFLRVLELNPTIPKELTAVEIADVRWERRPDGRFFAAVVGGLGPSRRRPSCAACHADLGGGPT